MQKWTTSKPNSVAKLLKSIPALNEFMNKFQGPSSSDPPLYTEGVDSNQPLHSHSNSLPRDPHLPRVEVNKFDGSDPQAWVTQMEHYFSLHGITDELTKLRYGILYLDPEIWKWWKWHRNACQGYVSWSQFVAELYERFDTDTHHLGCLTKLKQSGTMEYFIASFEHLDFPEWRA
jgi:hypothetical protein